MPNNVMFEFLNELRDSGVTNMFGATPYLQEEFDLNKAEAGEVLVSWMESFREKSKQSTDS